MDSRKHRVEGKIVPFVFNMKAMLKRSPILFALLLMACHSDPSVKTKKPTPRPVPGGVSMSDSSLSGSFSDQSSLRFDSLQLDSFFAAYPSLLPYAGDVRRFYRGRNDAFAWYDTRGLIEQAGHLHNRIQNCSPPCTFTLQKKYGPDLMNRQRERSNGFFPGKRQTTRNG